MGSLGFNMVPSTPDLIDDPAAYFVEYRQQLEAAKAIRDGETPEGEEEEEEVAAFWVTEPGVPVTASELGSKAKAAFLAAAAMGWEPRAWRSRSHHEPTLFKSTSAEGAKNHHDAGDVRYPAFERRTYMVTAKHPQMRLGFTAVWVGKGDTGTSGGFDFALVYDPLGLPIENRANYEVSLAHKTPHEVARLKLRAELFDYLYNDRSVRNENRVLMHSAGDLTVWMDDWLEQLAPGHKKLTPVKKDKAPEPEYADLARIATTNEWSSE